MTSIRDVARVAGVSPMTVSRVINGHPNVSSTTRTKVEEVVRTLGFRPSTAARALSVGSARAVTVVTSNTSLYGYASTLSGIEEAARAAGVAVSVVVLESDEPEVVQATAHRVGDPREGGVIVLAYDRAGSRALEAMPAGASVAAAVESILGPRQDELGVPCAFFDDITAARTATGHLLELGHTTVHHLAIPSSTAVGDRQRGWEQALLAAGAPVPPVVRLKTFDTAGAHAAAMRLLTDPAVTAVLCGNDDQALGVLRAAHDLGRDVPGDLSVVGFDDVPAAAYYTPALTTVRFDFAALGRRTFELLGSGPQTPRTTVVPAPELVLRESTGAPRGGTRT